MLRELLRDFVGGALRLEEFGIEEDRAEEMERPGIINVRVCELVGLLDGAIKVGADDVTVEIAHHEQRRIEQGLAITQKLLIGGIEVFLLTFVFPGEEAALPNIGKTTLAF